jgi:benzoyl-CoA 2,3-dioxygenase component B
MSTIDLQAKIPNNVSLADNRQLQRALEHWQPAFLRWWDEMGPSDFKAKDVYLRTAVGVDAPAGRSTATRPCPTTAGASSWPTGRRGRKIGFGDFMGQDAWQEVPGEFRSAFRRLIVTQGDTEPHRWSSSACWATPRLRSTTCATCSR